MLWLRALPGVFRLVPREVWYVLAAAILFAGARGWYHGKLDDAEKRGEARAYAAVEQKARSIQAKSEALAAKLREQNDETNRRIDGDARTVLVRGPGKAACPAARSEAPRQPLAPGRPADAAVDRVPYPEWQQLIGLPFAGAVEFARQCDLNRAEVLTWRDNYQKQRELVEGFSR